jgi:hypothetical protein
MKVTVFCDVATDVSEVLTALMIEEVNTSETSENSTRLDGATSQKAVIFNSSKLLTD